MDTDEQDHGGVATEHNPLSARSRNLPLTPEGRFEFLKKHSRTPASPVMLQQQYGFDPSAFSYSGSGAGAGAGYSPYSSQQYAQYQHYDQQYDYAQFERQQAAHAWHTAYVDESPGGSRDEKQSALSGSADRSAPGSPVPASNNASAASATSASASGATAPTESKRAESKDEKPSQPDGSSSSEAAATAASTQSRDSASIPLDGKSTAYPFPFPQTSAAPPPVPPLAVPLVLHPAYAAYPPIMLAPYAAYGFPAQSASQSQRLPAVSTPLSARQASAMASDFRLSASAQSARDPRAQRREQRWDSRFGVPNQLRRNHASTLARQRDRVTERELYHR